MSQYRPYRTIKPIDAAPAVVHKPIKKWMLFAAVLAVIVFGFLALIATHTASVRAQALAEAQTRAQRITEMTKNLNNLINDQSGVKYYISIKDSLGSKSYDYNAYNAQDAASTAKLITAALFLNNVEKNKASINEQINGYKASFELRAMVNRSDDSAWFAFNDKLGHYRLDQYLASLDINTYDADANSISAADMTKFLKLLDEGDLLSADHTSLLLGYMQNTNYEDFVSPAVSSKFALNHKVGIDEDHVNDAAIIHSGKNNLYLTIFTDGQGTYNWADRAKIFQRITTEAINAYLN